jgi:hypothetical protein
VAYKGRGARVRVELIKNGTEVLVSANPEGLRYLAEISAGLADEKHDPRSPQHVHVEPALNSADAESVPMEFLLKLDW